MNCDLSKPDVCVLEANVQKHIKHARLCGRYVGERRGTERRGVIQKERKSSRVRVKSAGKLTRKMSYNVFGTVYI